MTRHNYHCAEYNKKKKIHLEHECSKCRNLFECVYKPDSLCTDEKCCNREKCGFVEK